MRTHKAHFTPAAQHNSTKYEICGITCCSIDDDKELKKNAGIYIIYNRETGIPYVGSTACLGTRYNAHFGKSHAKKPANKKLGEAIAKYGT